MFSTRFSQRLAALMAGLAASLAGCGQTPPVVSKPLPSAVVSHATETLDPSLFDQLTGEREGDAYLIGPGDSLLVAIYGHPELAITAYAGQGYGMGRAPGLVVDNDGSVQVPLVGRIQAAGRTSEQLRVFLENALTAYLKEPHVTVQVSQHGSIRYYLLGQFTTPGMKQSDRPLHLLEGLSMGGSVVFEHASLMSAYVARNGKRLPIDFERLLRQGDMKQNIPLRSGDIVVVPDNSGDRVFVFGGIMGERAGIASVPFMAGRLDILQALAQAGFGFKERAQGVLSETRVIRSRGDHGELLVVDVDRILAGEAATFRLAPGDVIFVPTSAWTDWNNALSQLLPTLNTISGLLSPFVQIKYLQRN